MGTRPEVLGHGSNLSHVHPLKSEGIFPAVTACPGQHQDGAGTVLTRCKHHAAMRGAPGPAPAWERLRAGAAQRTPTQPKTALHCAPNRKVHGIGVPDSYRRSKPRARSGFFYVHVLRMAHGFLFGGPCGAPARVRRTCTRYANPHGLPPLDWRRGRQFIELLYRSHHG